MTAREQAKGERCDCTAYARWMTRLNGESPGECYYRNPWCPEHQGDSFPDHEAQQAELRATALEGRTP